MSSTHCFGRSSGWIGLALVSVGLLSCSTPTRLVDARSVGPAPHATLGSALLAALQAEGGADFELVMTRGTAQGANPRLVTTVIIDGAGATVQPQGSASSPMRLGLTGWGCAGGERELARGVVVLDGPRRATVRRGSIEEWFSNGPLGLEQGFDVNESPGDCRSLRFRYAPSPGLAITVVDGGRAVQLVDAGGVARHRIDHAAAWDRDGRALATRFEASDRGFSLRVEAHGARYPIRVDPLAWVLEGELSPATSYEYFGLDVAIYADTAVVGAYMSDAAGPASSGAAYVFRRVGGLWSHVTTLTAPDAAAGDWFGWEVDIWGDTIVVGVMKDDTLRGTDAGSVRVFREVAGTWSQQAVIEPATSGAETHFGCGAAVYADTIVAGPYGGPDLPSVGSAYVFTRSAGVWSQQARLRPRAAPSDRPAFGRKVAIWGDVVAVGAMMEDGPAGTNEGAVYVFARSGAVWSEQVRLRHGAATANAWFGYEVDMGSRALVASIPGDWSLSLADSLAIFEDSGTGYTEVARFPHTTLGELDKVATYGDWVVGDELVYERAPSGWTLFASLERYDRQELHSAAIFGDTIIAGWSPASTMERASVYRLSEASPVGTACASDGECASGFCTEGVCCESDCTTAAGPCRSCRTARTGALDGRCRPLSAGIAATTLCRPAVSACDLPDYCSPMSVDCPENAFASAGTVCGAPRAACDAAEVCTGTSATCPPDGFAAAGVECRPAAGPCDVSETCSGASAACPPDGYLSSSTCRPAADVCDVAERCSGTSPSCPADLFARTSSMCRPSVGSCDVADYCDGRSATCGADEGRLDGTPCDDGLTCNGVDRCASGACVPSAPPDCDDGDGCTADACSDSDGTCTHAPIEGCCRVDTDCEDGDLCTDDACDGAVCVHELVPVCMDAGASPEDAGVGVSTDAGRADAGAADADIDTDAGETASPRSGCGCRAAGGPERPSSIFVALVLVFGRRRRGLRCP